MLPLILSALLATSIFFGGGWLGWLVMGRPSAHGASRDALVAAWIGWYLLAMAVLACGWLGLLSRIWLGLIVVAPLGAAFLDRRAFGAWLTAAARDYGRALRAPLGVWIPAVAIAVWALLQLSAPPFHYDLLTYGFAQPVHWLSEGRIGPVGPDMYAYEAVPSRMHFMLALGLGGAPMAGWSLFLWTIAAALLAARAVALMVGEGKGWSVLAAATLLVTPAVWDLLLLRKDDLSALWGGAALLVLHLGLWKAERLSRRDLLALALAAAAALAAKPGVTGGYVIALVAFTWWRGARIEKVDSIARRRIVAGAILAAIVIAALLPIAVHTWLGLGHPLASAFPQLSRYDISSTRWVKALADAYPFEPQPLSRLLPYALLELSRFYNPARWNFGDNLGLIILLGLPVALLASRHRPLAWIWLAGIAGWFVTFHWPRFALVLLPLEVLLVVDLLSRITRPARVAVLLAVVAGLHGYFYAGLTVTGSQVFRPAVAALFGNDEPLPFVPGSVRVCEQVNATLDPASSRLMFVGETRAYPCHVPFDFWNAHFRHPFERVEPGVDPATAWDRHVADHGITHVVYSPEAARKRMEWSPEMHERLQRWLSERGRVVARASDRESTTFLVELRGPTLSDADR